MVRREEVCLKQRKRCVPCSRGKHSQCTGLSARGDGRECPCCSGLGHEERVNKEGKQKEKRRKARENAAYERYANCWDNFLLVKKRALGVNHSKDLGPFLPRLEQDKRAWAKEAGLSLDWFELFLRQFIQDYSL